MQTQLVDAHYLIESRQKKKLFSKFHTLKQFSKSKTSEKLLEEKLCSRGQIITLLNFSLTNLTA